MNLLVPASVGIAAGEAPSRGSLLVTGSLLIILGVVGLSLAYTFTTVVLLWFGLLALAAGAGQLLEAYHGSGWQSRTSHVLMGLIYIAAALAFLLLPASAAYWLSLALALLLVASGFVRFFEAARIRGAAGRQLLVLVGGVIAIGLGVFIYARMTPPDSEVLSTLASQRAWIREWGRWLGLFVAIELIVQGVLLLAAAVGARPNQPAQVS